VTRSAIVPRHRRDVALQLARVPAERLGPHPEPGPCDLERGPCGIRAWQRCTSRPRSCCRLAASWPGARRARVAVFITGRPGDLQDRATSAKSRATRGTASSCRRATGRRRARSTSRRPRAGGSSSRATRSLLTIGDQESDLAGGFAERGFQLPNPVYFLP
jgi:acid phosphatase